MVADLTTAPLPAAPVHASAPVPGRLRLVLQGSRLLDGPLAPRVRVDGFPLALGFGEHHLELAAGRHEVAVHCRWLRCYGAATAHVDVPADGSAVLHYAPPRHEWAPGRLGPETQTPAGGLAAGVAVLVALYLAAFVTQLLLR